jgi:glyoxylase-like metal-dependent hydrolase (beta-lactamase superfamily II)/rhodanese-related sulfurtransferase
MKVIPFVHEGLGNSSYLVQLNQDSAVLVDPDRSVQRYLQEAKNRGLRISAVFETHLHADFVTGSRELLGMLGVEPHAALAGKVQFPHRAVQPGDELAKADARVRVIGSPGHTPEHVSYVIEAPRPGPAVLFSGGSLIVGGAARTDLIAPDMTEELTRAQYQTLKSAFAELPDETLLYPTHGGGSFCSTGAGGERTSTLGHERATNALLQFTDEEEFVRWFPTSFPGAPDYFYKMRPINRAGPRLRREIADPPALSPQEFQTRIDSSLVIDTRPIDQYHRAHIPGSLSIAFRPSFGTWLGWLVPLGTPLLFVTNGAQLEDIVNESLLVGQESLAGWLEGGIEAWEHQGLPVLATRSISPDEVRSLLEDGAIAVDVREPSEFASGHIDDAVNIALGSLAGLASSLPVDRPVVAYCGHGERSTTGTSILERAGVKTAINLEGGIGAWRSGTS